MKHMSWMLVFALLAMSPVFADDVEGEEEPVVTGPWVPIPDTASCPEAFDEATGDPVDWIPMMSALPKIHGGEYIGPAWQERPLTFPDPAAGQFYDFCGIFDILFCSLGPIADVAGDDVLEFANLVQCMYADLNGIVDLEASIPVTPNGMHDAYELGLVAAILNDPANAYHDEVKASFDGFFLEIKNLLMLALSDAGKYGDLRSVVSGGAPGLVPGLSAVLAGFCVMGDDDTNLALDMLIGLLADIGLEPPEGGIASLGTAVPELGPNGDADGDGFTNKEEYRYFVGGLQYDIAGYVAVVLDPEEVPDLPQVVIDGPERRVSVGDTVTLTASITVGDVIEYAWKFQGVILEDEVGASLVIENAQVEDSGIYTAVLTVDDGAKAIEIYEADFIINVSEFAVPVGGALGLSIFAGACALAGAMGIRRRK